MPRSALAAQLHHRFMREAEAVQAAGGNLAAKGIQRQLAIQRDAFYDKFHFWLALAHYHLGELDEARKQLKIAQDTSTTRSDLELYTETLARLSSGQRVEMH